MPSRLILVGVDSLDRPLTKRWVADGLLPNFGALFHDNPLVLLSKDSVEPLPPAAWLNMLTGTSPGFHGFVEGTSLRRNQRDASEVSADRVYKTLSDAGISCAVVDVPVDFPIRPFNGLHVVDWGTEFGLWGGERPKEDDERLVDQGAA